MYKKFYVIHQKYAFLLYSIKLLWGLFLLLIEIKQSTL